MTKQVGVSIQKTSTGNGARLEIEVSDWKPVLKRTVDYRIHWTVTLSAGLTDPEIELINKGSSPFHGTTITRTGTGPKWEFETENADDKHYKYKTCKYAIKFMDGTTQIAIDPDYEWGKKS